METDVNEANTDTEEQTPDEEENQELLQGFVSEFCSLLNKSGSFIDSVHFEQHKNIDKILKRLEELLESIVGRSKFALVSLIG